MDSAPFEEWVTVQRERLAREMLAALQRLAAHCEESGDYAAMQPTRGARWRWSPRERRGSGS